MKREYSSTALTIEDDWAENEYLKTYALCLNSKRTSYYGVASATAIVGGKEKHALDDFSDKPVALECGT